MNNISEEKENTRDRKRIIALILSGLTVLIIIPLISIFVSNYFTTEFNLPIVLFYPLNVIIAIVVFLFGFFWAGWSNIVLYKIGKGTPVPLKGTQTIKLVIQGPYKYTRNPMVFGYILLWIGLGLLFNSYIILIGFTTLMLVFLILFVKLWEEKNLEQRFGESYREYKSRVSMILPLPEKKK